MTHVKPQKIRLTMAASAIAICISSSSAIAQECEISDLSGLPRGQVTPTAQANFACLASQIATLKSERDQARDRADKLERRMKAEEERTRDPAFVPAGAVVAFDRPNGCPTGWIDTGPSWGGSTLVAAVTDTNNRFGFRRTGGAITHTLTENEMPRHRHPVRFGAGAGLSSGSVKYLLAAGGNESATALVGGNAAHNNMPPYIALYFCKKEGG